jgi:phosphatidylethanolamine/phosphatidyl-N-methylethanolamine N-methyltransferase
MGAQMQEATTKQIYDVQASFYDKTFGRLVKRRIARAIEHMRIGPADLVLDLGIGTGNSLHFYPRQARVIGIDLSAGMLAKCLQKIQELGMENAHAVQGDAMLLPFADDVFDHVFISHVISVVSDPYQLVREAQRVGKPGGRIVIVNHFQSSNRLVALVEKWLCPLCTKLGWRTDLVLADLVRQTGLSIDYRYQHAPLDLWETVVTTNDKSSLIRAKTAA